MARGHWRGIILQGGPADSKVCHHEVPAGCTVCTRLASAPRPAIGTPVN